MDWRAFWEAYPRRFDETEFRKQVGRTHGGGVPTSEAELARVMDQVVERLELGGHHRLLDLCCGNGYLTARLAAVAREVVGVDFSAPMLALARRHHAGHGISYLEGSVLELDAVLDAGAAFDRVCMLESLHYFEPDQLAPLLEGLLRHTSSRAVVYLSGIPDAERKDRFFDTPERWREYERRRAEGTDGMGHWWRGEEIEAGARALGLRCRILPQSPELHTAYYRFDAVLRRS